MMSEEKNILLFHHSDRPRSWSDDFQTNQQCFCWFSDRFHELSYIGSQYIYFFLVNPRRDNIRLVSRPFWGGFHGLYSGYLHRRETFENEPTFDRWNTEPPFISTYSKLIPNLGAKFNEKTEEYTILFPQEHAGKKFRLFDQYRHRQPFNTIPMLTEALPGLIDAYPYVNPPLHEGHYWFPDWRDENPELTFDPESIAREKRFREERKSKSSFGRPLN